MDILKVIAITIEESCFWKTLESVVCLLCMQSSAGIQ